MVYSKQGGGGAGEEEEKGSSKRQRNLLEIRCLGRSDKHLATSFIIANFSHRPFFITTATISRRPMRCLYSVVDNKSSSSLLLLLLLLLRWSRRRSTCYERWSNPISNAESSETVNLELGIYIYRLNMYVCMYCT